MSTFSRMLKNGSARPFSQRAPAILSHARKQVASGLFQHLAKAALLCPVVLGLVSSLLGQQHPNLGRPLTPGEIRKIDITIASDGAGLPAGSGSVSAGATVYAQK